MGDTSDSLPGVKGLGLGRLRKLFPKLNSSDILTLDDLNKTCEEMIEKEGKKSSKYYSQILENATAKRLRQNWEIMNLIDINFETYDKKITDVLETPPTKLQSLPLKRSIHLDILGRSIPNVNSFVQNYNTLNQLAK